MAEIPRGIKMVGVSLLAGLSTSTAAGLVIEQTKPTESQQLSTLETCQDQLSEFGGVTETVPHGCEEYSQLFEVGDGNERFILPPAADLPEVVGIVTNDDRQAEKRNSRIFGFVFGSIMGGALTGAATSEQKYRRMNKSTGVPTTQVMRAAAVALSIGALGGYNAEMARTPDVFERDKAKLENTADKSRASDTWDVIGTSVFTGLLAGGLTGVLFSMPGKKKSTSVANDTDKE